LPLPKQVFGHGFVYNKGAKISKSAGTAIDPMDVFRRHGSEAFRYYFLRECPFGGDGNFNEERFAEVYNSDLANNLGNLYSRTLSMALKYFDGQLAPIASSPSAWTEPGKDLRATISEIRELTASFQFNVALQRIWSDILDPTNRFIQTTEPFKLAKTDIEACRVVLVNLAEVLRVVAILIKPFLPRTAETFYRAFNFDDFRPWPDVRFDHAFDSSGPLPELRVTASLVAGKPAPLFPKIDMKIDA